MQPGDTITPNDAPQGVLPEVPPAAVPTPAPQQSPVQQPQPQAPPQQVVATPEPQVASLPPQDDASWQFNQEAAPAEPEQFTDIAPVRWTASEYIAHAKSPVWFVATLVGTVVLMAAVFLLTGDIFATIVVGLASGAFMVVAARQPRVLEYVIDRHGIQIGQTPLN